MDKFLESTRSLEWWFSVVIVGLLVNIASHYVARNMDTQLSSISGWWRKRSENRKAKQRVMLKVIEHDPILFLHEAILSVRLRVKALALLCMAILTLLLALFLGVSGPWGVRLLSPQVHAWLITLSSLMCLTAMLAFMQAYGTSSELAELTEKAQEERVLAALTALDQKATQEAAELQQP